MSKSIKTKRVFVFYNEKTKFFNIYSTIKTMCELNLDIKANTLYKHDFDNKTYVKGDITIFKQKIC